MSERHEVFIEVTGYMINIDGREYRVREATQEKEGLDATHKESNTQEGG